MNEASLNPTVSYKHICDSNILENINESKLYLFLPKTSLKHSLKDKHSLKNAALSYLLFCSILEDAIKKFLNFEFCRFDPIIGNNSCYLSAYVIFLISSRLEKDPTFKEKLFKALLLSQKVKRYLISLIDASTTSSCSDFEEYIYQNRIELELDLDIIYLGLSYGCTLSKSSSRDNFDQIDYEKLMDEYPYKFNKKSVFKLVKRWQKTIAILNVKTIQRHSNFLVPSENQWAKYIHDPYVLHDSHGRPCIPSFYASKVIFLLLLQEIGAVVSLQVNVHNTKTEFSGRFSVNFEVQKNKKLKFIDPNKVPRYKPIYTFGGCRYLNCQTYVRDDFERAKSEFSFRDLEEIIFAHEVTYPQYPKSLNTKNIIPTEKGLEKEYRSLIMKTGFSLSDPSDLCLAHIFVENIDTQEISIYETTLKLPNYH